MVTVAPQTGLVTGRSRHWEPLRVLHHRGAPQLLLPNGWPWAGVQGGALWGWGGLPSRARARLQAEARVSVPACGGPPSGVRTKGGFDGD